MKLPYVVYLDFENLWVSNQEIALPTLYKRQVAIPEALRAQLHEQLAKFPALLNDIIKEQFGGQEAREKFAIAIWDGPHGLHHRKPTNLDATLTSLSYHRKDTLPAHEVSGLFAGDLKDASDFALIAHLIEISDGRGKDDSTIVIGGGDCGPVYFIDYLMKKGFQILFVCFSTKASPLIARAATRLPTKVKYLALDKTTIYQKYLSECVAIDPEHAKKSSVPLEVRVQKTAIHALWFSFYGNKTKPWKPQVHLFRSTWIKGWLEFWNHHERELFDGKDPKFQKERYWFQWLQEEEIIETAFQGYPKPGQYISLNTANAQVTADLDELKKDDKAFRLKYNVASVMR